MAVASIAVSPVTRTEKEAVQTMANLVKNPPKNPVEMIRWVSSNFTVSAELTGAISKVLPSIGKVLPIAGAIFDVFSSFSAPSIGEQIASAVETIASQIAQAVDALRDALEFSAEKTITAIQDQLQAVTQEESAARVMQALEEAEILQEVEAEKAKLFAEYQQSVNALNEAWKNEMADEIASAQAEVSAAYQKIQELLAYFGIDILSELTKLYEDWQNSQNTMAATARTLPDAAPVAPLSQADIGGNSTSLVMLGAGALALFFLMKQKKH